MHRDGTIRWVHEKVWLLYKGEKMLMLDGVIVDIRSSAMTEALSTQNEMLIKEIEKGRSMKRSP